MMRKFFTVLLALLLAAVSVCGASAATALPTCVHDGSTAAQGEMQLVVTEMMTNSTNSYALDSTRLTNASHQDAFTYIEVYNKGEVAVDMAELSLARYKDVQTYNYSTGTFDHDFYSNKFDERTDIKAGSIYDGINVRSSVRGNACENPTDLTVDPGELAILWIWNDATVAVDTQYQSDLGMPVNVDGVGDVYHYYFRQHYGMELNNDVPIIAVYGGDTTDTSDSFTLNKSSNYVYGLVKDTFALTETVFEQNDGETVLNDKVLCTWQWGVARATGIASAGDKNIETANKNAQGNAITIFKASPYEGKATLYAPAASDPFYYNAQRAVYNSSYTNKVNYVDIGANYVFSYKEMAVMCPATEAGASTIGKMDDAQLAQVDPTRAAAKAQTAGQSLEAWTAAANAAFLQGRISQGTGEVEDNPETAITLDSLSGRDDLGNRGQNRVPGANTAPASTEIAIAPSEQGASPLAEALLCVTAAAGVLIVLLGTLYACLHKKEKHGAQ